MEGRKFNMYSVCFKTTCKGGVKGREFISFGFPFYAKDHEEAKSLAVQSYLKHKEVEPQLDASAFDLFKVASFQPENPIPLQRSQRLIKNLADLVDDPKYIPKEEVVNDAE